MEKSLILEKEQSIAIISLNRPDKRNSLNQDLLAKLYDAFEDVTHDKSVHVVILTGKGKTFCAGLDLSAIGKENLMNPRGDGKMLPEVRYACQKPVIGAINGHAITGGFELALMCDFLIAGQSASFADTHVKVGIHPGWGMTQQLQRIVGVKMARQISFTGDFLSAQKALEIGMVNEVVDDEKLMDRTKAIARTIASHNQEMLMVIKNLIDTGHNLSLNEALNMEASGFAAFIKKAGI